MLSSEEEKNLPVFEDVLAWDDEFECLYTIPDYIIWCDNTDEEAKREEYRNQLLDCKRIAEYPNGCRAKLNCGWTVFSGKVIVYRLKEGLCLTNIFICKEAHY